MMNKCVVALGIGLVVGAYLGYANEEEIDEMAHLMQKNQKKMSRKAHVHTVRYATAWSTDHSALFSYKKSIIFPLWIELWIMSYAFR